MIKREAFIRQQTALLGTHGFDVLTLITDGEKETGEEMREIRIGEIGEEGGLNKATCWMMRGNWE